MDAERTHRPRFDLSRILVIDLEATCWHVPPPPGEEHEVIEIGNAILQSGLQFVGGHRCRYLFDGAIIHRRLGHRRPG
jgi:hypothetical protein